MCFCFWRRGGRTFASVLWVGDAFLFISLAMCDGIPLLCGASFFFSSSDCFIWLGEYAPEGVSANR